MSSSKKRKNANSDLHRQLSDLKDTLSNAVGEKASDVKDKATEMVNTLLENLQESSHDYKEDIEERITNKPIQSVLIAVGVGVLLSKILL
jgi:ElaB/YqjD/DUF883 family membrane-anchored ribosome-binding protein